jgi:nicotinamidase-related amidase
MMDAEAKKIITPILDLTRAFRGTGNHVVFACDSFMEGDYPAATISSRNNGDHPIPELEMRPSDLFLPKRRMSSFSQNRPGSDFRTWEFTPSLCAESTPMCVLTAMDAIETISARHRVGCGMPPSRLTRRP